MSAGYCGLHCRSLNLFLFCSALFLLWLHTFTVVLGKEFSKSVLVFVYLHWCTYLLYDSVYKARYLFMYLVHSVVRIFVCLVLWLSYLTKASKWLFWLAVFLSYHSIFAGIHAKVIVSSACVICVSATGQRKSNENKCKYYVSALWTSTL